MLAAGVLGAWACVLLPGRFSAHYYQLYLPVLVVGAGWGVAALWHRSRLVGTSAAAAALGISLMLQLPGLLARGEDWVRKTHRHEAERYIAQMRAIPTVLSLLQPGESVYQVGSQTAYTIAAKTSPPTGVFFLKHMAEGPAAERLTKMALSNLTANPPAVVVYDSVYARSHPQHPIHGWVAENYEPRPELSAGRRASIHVRRKPH
jgi:hypothetical protein